MMANNSWSILATQRASSQ